MVIKTQSLFKRVPALIAAAKATSLRYIKLIEKQLERNDPEKYAFVIAELERYDADARKIVEFGEISAIDQLVSLYDIIYSIENGAEVVRELLGSELYYKSITSKMSSTFDIDVAEIRAAAMKAWTDYDNLIHDASDELFTDMAAAIQPKDINTLISSRSRVALGLLRIVAPVAPDASKSKINLFIERQKDEVLGAARVHEATKVLYPAQAIPYRFGLTPRTRMMNVYDLGRIVSPTFTYNTEKSRAANLRAIADAAGAGLIIAHNGFGTRLEFDIRALVDEKYVMEHDLNVSIMEGLSKKGIERFTTIMHVDDERADSNGNGKRPAIMYSHYLPAATKKIIYFETFNGYKFRILGRGDEYTINADDVAGLIYGASTRPTRYNTICGSTIFDKCITKTTEPVVNRYENLEPGLSTGDVSTAGMSRDTSTIKNKIRDLLVAGVDLKTKNYYKAYKHATRDVGHVLMKVLPAGLSNEERVTYLYKIYDLADMFDRELRAAYNDAEFSSSAIGHIKAEDLPAYLAKTYGAIFSRALDAMDAKGIWSLYDASLKELYIGATNIY